MRRTLLFILAFLPMLASADAIEIDGIYYNLDREAKTAEVTSRPNQYESDVAIPESVTYNVVVYSVTSIGDGAFRWCSGLTSVTIPNSVTFIGQWAFYKCSGLTSITIPSSVTSIGELAFSGCSGLTSVTIPNSVKTIGESAFNGCENLSSVTIANGVTSIGVAAFQLCTSLTSLTIPSSVTAIAEDAFQGCSGLQSIVIDKGNTVYDSREDCNAIIKTSDNELISGCTNSTIPNSVTKIGQSAFKNCKGLRSVRIPNSVVSVGQFAFQGCSGMTSITIPNSVTSIGSYAFGWCSGLTSITIPDGVSSIDEFVFYGCTALQSIEVEDGNPAVCSVDGVLFNKEKTKLLSYPAGATQTSYTVPESVTWIEPLAFSYSQHLRVVTLTDYVTELGYSAFYECKSLEEVRLPSGLKTLANYLFGNCQRLKSVTIPQGVTYLGLKAFYCCTSLTSVTMPESITSTDYSVFEGCTSLKSVTLSPNLSKIEYNMFANCSSLKKLLIPNSVTMVGSEAFKNCSALTSLDLPKSINRLGYSVFAGCKLNSLYIRGVIDSHWMSSSIFTDMDTQTELYVLSSEMEKFQAIYKGPIYPLPQMSNDVMINETTFPDEIFRKWVLNQEYGKDGILTEKEIAGVTFMNLFPQNLIAVGHIKSLKGIEYFTAVTKIVCSMNELTELDLSKNTALTCLECYGNHLTKLDLSKNTALTTLDCNGNELTALNVLDCASLSSLRCDNNRLTQLDMSENTELSSLVCNNNQLTQLDVSKNTELTELRCHENQLTALDLSKNKKLKTLRTYHNPINGVAMDALIESLPKVSRGVWSCVLNKDEEGSPTTTQVAAAKKKGWTSYYWDEAAKSWKEYAGTEAPQMAYHPFVEDDKVWIVRVIPSWAIPDMEQTERYFEYYYFDGDTIINEQTAKRMLYDRIGSNWDTIGEYIGAWYEQDKKVYYAGKGKQQFELLYDFTLSTGDIIQSEDLVLQVTKMSGGIPGFKGTYYDLQYINYTPIVERWLEGVGSEYYPWLNLRARWAGAAVALLVCKAGDEIIYYNSEEEDPFSMGAKKHRFDFTHTIKTKPKAPSKREKSDARINSSEREVARPKVKARTREDDAEALYGEYNNQLLDIRLNPLDATYLVRITNESEQVVYEKNVNAGNIVGLNIDISAFAKGRYTVTMENSSEVFTGEFETITTGIQELINEEETKNFNSSTLQFFNSIYNLQGQRLNTLQKGLNIVNGRKVLVK